MHISADQGRLLDYIVSWGNLTEEKVSFYLRDILEALHYLHACRIAHLDLKVGLSIELFLNKFVDHLGKQVGGLGTFPRELQDGLKCFK